MAWSLLLVVCHTSSFFDLPRVSFEPFTATKYSKVLPVCPSQPILPSSNAYLLLIYSTWTRGCIKKKLINALMDSQMNVFVLALCWRSSTQLWHMDLLSRKKCFLWAGRMKQRRILHLTVSPFQSHESFAHKVNKPAHPLMQSPLSYSAAVTDCIPSPKSSHPHLAQKNLFHVLLLLLTTCPQSPLHSLYHYRWYLFYYLILLSHRAPSLFFRFFACFSG